MTQPQELGFLFVKHASDILAHTNSGFSGTDIIRLLTPYAIELNVNIPYAIYPFDAPNKRTALLDNLMAFSQPQRYRIIRELCDEATLRFPNVEDFRKLKLQLMTRYGHLAAVNLGADINENLVEQTRHWLDSFPEVLGLFNQAMQKYETHVFARNLLDDLRLALEKLVQILLGNSKSLENQTSGLGTFVKERGGSPELSNMFLKLINYYCNYQNNYIKHDDAVIEEELEFVIEITAAFMKHFVRLAGKNAI